MVNMFINNNNGNRNRNINSNTNGMNRVNPNVQQNQGGPKQRFSIHVFPSVSNLSSSLRLNDVVASDPRDLKTTVDRVIVNFVRSKFSPNECSTLNIGSMRQASKGVFEIQFRLMNEYRNVPTYYTVLLQSY